MYKDQLSRYTHTHNLASVFVFAVHCDCNLYFPCLLYYFSYQLFVCLCVFPDLSLIVCSYSGFIMSTVYFLFLIVKFCLLIDIDILNTCTTVDSVTTISIMFIILPLGMKIMIRMLIVKIIIDKECRLFILFIYLFFFFP